MKKITAESNHAAQEFVRQQKAERLEKLNKVRQERYEVGVALRVAELKRLETGVAPPDFGELRSRYQLLTNEVKQLGG